MSPERLQKLEPIVLAVVTLMEDEGLRAVQQNLMFRKVIAVIQRNVVAHRDLPAVPAFG